jgi:F0F1-type ATP synthase assembly protein I
MIKNLLDADENPPPGTKVSSEKTLVEPAIGEGSKARISIEKPTESEDILEIPAAGGNAKIFETTKDSMNSRPISEMFSEPSKPQIETATLFQSEYKPESQAETIRKSGLAYAAAITLFASIAFLLIIGWFADLFLGTSPWGTLAGIILGAIIGFFQFFRITSQIINNKK